MPKKDIETEARKQFEIEKEKDRLKSEDPDRNMDKASIVMSAGGFMMLAWIFLVRWHPLLGLGLILGAFGFLWHVSWWYEKRRRHKLPVK